MGANSDTVRRCIWSNRRRPDLPRPVDPTAARATLNLGVLVVMAPVAEPGASDAGEHRPAVTLTAVE